MKKIVDKKRKLLDAETTLSEVAQHSFVNFLYGLLNGLAIAAISKGNIYLIFVSFYLLKQVEARVLNRNRYTTNFGKNVIFPIPSTVGFLIGWKISTYI